MADHEALGEGLSEDLEQERQQAARLEMGRLLFAKECSFINGVANLSQLPVPNMPEIAFAGRSNVGKSSLINALTGRTSLARTSNTPGRTQQLNFFDLGKRLMLVDLPGYGFAQAPKDQVAVWTRTVNDYLRGRVVLKRAFVLIDSRHGLKDVDREVLTMLDKAAVIYQLVLTKADKIKASELAAVEQAVAQEVSRRPAAFPIILSTSSEKGYGIAELRATMAELALPPV